MWRACAHELSGAWQQTHCCHHPTAAQPLPQNSCQWDRAIAVATKYDRVHLTETHFNYAKFLEQSGDLPVCVGERAHPRTTC
ncbi:hypothetical protein EON67_03115 [archaeon]|nr:MAG: hypothetical protein EON67_03115 [archaeon]